MLKIAAMHACNQKLGDPNGSIGNGETAANGVLLRAGHWTGMAVATMGVCGSGGLSTIGKEAGAGFFARALRSRICFGGTKRRPSLRAFMSRLMTARSIAGAGAHRPS